MYRNNVETALVETENTEETHIQVRCVKAESMPTRADIMLCHATRTTDSTESPNGYGITLLFERNNPFIMTTELLVTRCVATLRYICYIGLPMSNDYMGVVRQLL